MQDAPLSLDELSSLVELSKKIVRKHYLMLHGADLLFIELHDTQAIFNVTSGYIEYLLRNEKEDLKKS